MLVTDCIHYGVEVVPVRRHSFPLYTLCGGSGGKNGEQRSAVILVGAYLIYMIYGLRHRGKHFDIMR